MAVSVICARQALLLLFLLFKVLPKHYGKRFDRRGEKTGSLVRRALINGIVVSSSKNVFKKERGFLTLVDILIPFVFLDRKLFFILVRSRYTIFEWNSPPKSKQFWSQSRLGSEELERGKSILILAASFHARKVSMLGARAEIIDRDVLSFLGFRKNFATSVITFRLRLWVHRI